MFAWHWGKADWLRSWWVLSVCLAIGLAARLLALYFVPVTPSSDAGWYFVRATELANGLGYQEKGYPTAYWPVGYPAFLSLLFRVFQPSVLVAQLANVALWAVTVIVLHSCVRNLTRQWWPANLAVILYSVYLNALGYTLLLLTETLYACMLVCAWRMAFALRNGHWIVAPATGVLLGLMTLVKAQTWLFALVWAALVMLLIPADRLRHASRLLVVVTMMFATVIPWSMRNLYVFGEFVLVSTNGGILLAATNHDYGTGTDAWRLSPYQAYVGKGVPDQVGADRRAKEVAWRWIRNNPWKFLALAPKKLWWAVVPDGESEWGFQRGYAEYEGHWMVFRGLRLANQFIYFAILALFALCAYRIAAKHRTEMRQSAAASCFIAGYFAMFLAVTFVFNGQSRYHFPLISLICGLIGWTAWLSSPAQWRGLSTESR